MIKRQTSGTSNDNEWQRAETSSTTTDNERQRMAMSGTANDNEWQRVVILANFPLFLIREEPTTKHPKGPWRRTIEFRAETGP